MKKTLPFVGLSLLLAAPSLYAKSVILFIGDGMGQAYVTAARNWSPGAPATLAMDRLPYTAICQTHSTDRRVTDSAAAATAMACGQKTVNDVLGQDATAVYRMKDGVSLPTLAERAKELGLSAGTVTTTRVTHATPAAFYAHINDRDREAEIADQLLASQMDLCFGGGRKYFPKGKVDPKRFRVVTDAKGLEKAAAKPGLPLLGLFAEEHMHFQTDPPGERKGEPSLAAMTAAAIKILSRNPKGYFLMVEGGRIDHAGHANNAKAAVAETLAFDEAIAEALKDVPADNTLVLVTADHETGGLAINGYPGWDVGLDGKGSMGDVTYPYLTFATGPDSRFPTKDAAHTGVDVPLYGWGWGAEKVHGTVDNTDIHGLALEALQTP